MNSKLDIGLAQLPEDTTSVDITDLYEAVHKLHEALSKLDGCTIYDPESYASIPITDTVNSQRIDRMYTVAAEPVAVRDFIKLTPAGVVKALYDGSNVSSDVHGIVTEVFPNSKCVVTRGGIVQGFSGLITGADYYLSSTVPGAYTDTASGSQRKEIIGLGVTADTMYVNLF